MSTQVDPFLDLGFEESPPDSLDAFTQLGFIEEEGEPSFRQKVAKVPQAVRSAIQTGREAIKGVIKKGGVGVARKLGGAYGDIIEAIRPSEAPSRLIRFPTSSEVQNLMERLGIETEPQNVAERFAKEAGEGVGSALAFLNPALAPAFAAGAVTGQALREFGAPEWMARIADIGVSLKGGLRGKGVRKPAPSKPSGLKTRTFEKITKAKTVFPKTLEKINTAVEGDFRKISSSLLGKNKTVTNLKNVPGFKDQVGKTFEKVEELAEGLPKNVLTTPIKQALRKQIEKKTVRGFSDSEVEKTYRKFMKEHHKNITNDTFISPKQLIEQYRKNNKELGKLYEPGKSRGFNEAKTHALIDYNKEIAATIERKYPKQAFSKLFKESNKQWAEIESFEKVTSTLDKFFDGKLNFNEVRKAISSNRFQKSLLTLNGEEGQKAFNTLNKDLLSTEKAHSLLKKAKEKGVAESILKHGKLFLISPWLSKAKLLGTFAGRRVKNIWQRGLSSPAYMTDWKKGINLMKKGEYRDAGIIFNRLYKEVEEEES